MNYTLDIQECVKTIFAAVVAGGINKDNAELQKKQDVYRACISLFEGHFSDNIFQDEYAFLYEMIKTLKIKVFSVNQMKGVLDRNRDMVLNSPYISLSKWSVTTDNRPTSDDEKIDAFGSNLEDLVNELSNMIVTEVEYRSAVETFTGYYIQQATLETVQNMAMILSDTGFLEKKTRGRSTLYKGVDDSNKYYNERQAVIRALSETDRVKSVVIDAEWLAKDMQKEEVADDGAILDFGMVEIDSQIGKMRRSNMITILGAPKGGKTRISNYLVQRALELKLNVCVWPLEGTEDEWTSCQVACMCRTHNGMAVDSKKVQERIYETDQIKQYVMANKVRLATDYTRGKLSFIEGTAYSEDFADIIMAHYANVNAFDVIVIDQMVNIMSKTGKQKVDRISSGYMQLKDIITNKLPRQALALLPAQLKQETIDYLRRNPGDTIDVTAGGESAETIRSADEVIGLFSTKEERNSNRMKLYHVASRHSANFDDFLAHCELGSCYFESDSSLNDGLSPNV